MRGTVVVVAALLTAGIANADPAAQKRSAELFAEGRKLIEAHDDAGACAKFDEAIKLDPDAAGTMLNLGLCNENLKKYRPALYWFRKAQARAHETNLPEYEAAAGDHTKAIAAQVATIQIETNPPDARVRLDGEVISPSEYLRVEIDGGHHAIDARAPGHSPAHQEFDVTGKGGQTIKIDMPVGEDSIVVDPGKTRRTAGIVTFSVGGAALIGAGVVAFIASRQYKCVTKGMIDMTLPDCANVDELTQRNKDNDAKSLAEFVATPLGIVGVVGVGLGVYLYLTAPQRERERQTVFVPTLSPDGAGFAAVGHF